MVEKNNGEKSTKVKGNEIAKEQVKKMDSYRKTAIIVGVLFITATVAYSLGMLFLDPILGSSDYLTKA
jgi:hypothetical protein